jgi:hypothetical protein
MTDSTIEGLLATATAGGMLLSFFLLLCIGGILFLLPLACTIDVAVSERKEGVTKAILIAAFFLTGGVVTIPYGLFFSEARWLRIVTALSIFMGIVTVAGCSVMLVGVQQASQPLQERKQKAKVEAFERALQDFKPQKLDSADITPFKAIKNVSADDPFSERVLTSFTLTGAQSSEAIQIDKSVRAVTPKTTKGDVFAITDHDVGVVSPMSGEFLKFDIEQKLSDFSWPKGIAYDETRERIVVLCSHVFNRLFILNIARNSWELLSQNRSGDSLQGLSYLTELDEYYAVVIPNGARTLEKLARFNGNGALVGYISLTPAIPVEGDKFQQYYQLVESSGKVMLVTPGLQGREARVFAIDVPSGTVFSAADTDASQTDEGTQ